MEAAAFGSLQDLIWDTSVAQENNWKWELGYQWNLGAFNFLIMEVYLWNILVASEILWNDSLLVSKF